MKYSFYVESFLLLSDNLQQYFPGCCRLPDWICSLISLKASVTRPSNRNAAAGGRLGTVIQPANTCLPPLHPTPAARSAKCHRGRLACSRGEGRSKLINRFGFNNRIILLCCFYCFLFCHSDCSGTAAAASATRKRAPRCELAQNGRYRNIAGRSPHLVRLQTASPGGVSRPA